MLKIDIVTRDFNVNNNGSDYAKIFTIKRYFLDQILYHENQLIFKIINGNSYNGCCEKTYFIGIYENTEHIDKIVFQDLSHNALVNEIDCVYVVNDDNDIDVYVKGTGVGSLLNVQFLYCRNIGVVQTYNYAKFNNDLSTLTKVSPVKQSKVSKWNSITLINNWVKDGGSTDPNPEYTIDNHGYVNLRGSISNSTLSGSISSIIGVLPVGFRPLTNSGFPLMSENNASGVYNLLVTWDGNLQVRTIATTVNARIRLDNVRFQQGR